MVRIRFNRRFKETRDREDEIIDACGFIAVKGGRALGNKLSALPVTEVLLEAKNVDRESEAEKKWMDSIGESVAKPIAAPNDDNHDLENDLNAIVPESLGGNVEKAEKKEASDSDEKAKQSGMDDDTGQPTLF